MSFSAKQWKILALQKVYQVLVSEALGSNKQTEYPEPGLECSDFSVMQCDYVTE